jgi:hypothetical protein
MKSSLFAGVAIFQPALAGLISRTPPELNNLTGPYTLTAYKPSDCVYNGGKVNNLNVFQEKVAQYCPFIGGESVNCPNGKKPLYLMLALS